MSVFSCTGSFDITEGVKEQEYSLIPPYDKDAKTPEEVYKLEDSKLNHRFRVNLLDKYMVNYMSLLDNYASTVKDFTSD